MKILGISGSLRASSANNQVIKIISKILPANTNFQIYSGLRHIPPFDDSEEPSKEVIDFRNLITDADGVIICTPEYAFGVPGILKNALDWTVSSGDFVNKPVALITAASKGDSAHASLLLTLTAISADIQPDTNLLISFVRAKLDEKGEIKDAATREALTSLVNRFVERIAAATTLNVAES
jgi:chromate reductase